MNLTFILAIMALVAVLLACLLPLVSSHGKQSKSLILAWNIAEGTHECAISKLADAALATRYLLVKPGSDAAHVAVNGASDKPLGIAMDEAAAAEDMVSVQFLNATESTRRMVASEAIADGANIYTAANGKVQDEPAVAGTYYRIGKARAAAAADGDVFEVETHAPIKVVVIAALTSSQNATTNGSDAGTTQALANALKVSYNALQADVAAIGAALATPAEIKVLT